MSAKCGGFECGGRQSYIVPIQICPLVLFCLQYIMQSVYLFSTFGSDDF